MAEGSYLIDNRLRGGAGFGNPTEFDPATETGAITDVLYVTPGFPNHFVRLDAEEVEAFTIAGFEAVWEWDDPPAAPFTADAVFEVRRFSDSTILLAAERSVAMPGGGTGPLTLDDSNATFTTGALPFEVPVNAFVWTILQFTPATFASEIVSGHLTFDYSYGSRRWTVGSVGWS